MSERTLQSWSRKVRDIDFLFTLKVPGEITHENLVQDTNRACSRLYLFQKSHLEVLERAGKLGAVLFQLPPYFRKEDVPKLIQLLSVLDMGRYRTFVEVRDRELHRDEASRREIEEAGGRLVTVDSPEVQIQDNMPLAGSRSYFRLHGRNSGSWWKKDAGKLEKYNYLYTRPELEAIGRIISGKAVENDEIFIYFNNHPAGNAPRNAMALAGIMQAGGRRDSQSTLI